jgi:hypothetical protein
MLGQGRPQVQGQGDCKSSDRKAWARPFIVRVYGCLLSTRVIYIPVSIYIRVNLRQSFVAERSRASGLLKPCWPTDSEICHGQNAVQGMHYFRDYSILSCWIPEA